MARKQKKMLACVVCIVLMLGTSVGAASYEGTLSVGGGGIIDKSYYFHYSLALN